ncbi:MAG: AraC family transcriptional regulator [Candidatus Ruminococcus intestinipullorum]|nr:AraC family transcriptional regulator [Candidatus Ruminococcus intestinipullorum]
MNTSYLIRYVSYNLHTIVKTWEHPAIENQSPSIFCGRPDLKDDFFDLKYFFSLIKSIKKVENPISIPLLFGISNTLYYAYITSSELDFLIGPVRFSTPIHMNQTIENISLSKEDISTISICEFSGFASQVLLVHNLMHQNCIDLDDLIQFNCIDKSLHSSIMEDYSSLVFDRREESQPHNPYDQELREFTSIELGNVQMLRKSLQEDYIGKIGTLAKDEVRNMRNRGIVVVTLASRAAIRGGLLPEISFSLSDIFIQKLEEESNPEVILNMMHQFEFQYAEMVAELNAQKVGRPKKDQNPRIEQCKDYIFQHLHEKISVHNMAKELYLNSNYLSELFHQHEGIKITDFILREKVNLTKNLLSYSPYTYSQIATYLGFSSQSHLGKVFKKHTGFTLKQYRDIYGVKEF